MDTLAPATLDAHGLSTREINERLRELLDGGAGPVDVLHPGSRHSLAVGFLDHPARPSGSAATSATSAAASPTDWTLPSTATPAGRWAPT